MSIWIQNLYDDSNFLGFHGSWVKRDFNQLVTAAFQGICEANSGRECVGLQLLQPVPCRNVLCYWSKLTDNTENEQRNSPLPSAPIWTTEHLREFVGLFMDLWLRETNFGRVIMIGNKSNLIWCYSSGQQLQNERSLSRYLIC